MSGLMQRSKRHHLYSITSSARHTPRRGPVTKRDELSCFVRSPHALLADLATDDIAEQFPTLAPEFLELHLFDRGEVGRAGVDRDAGQKTLLRQTPDARCLPHNIFAGKIVTAGF
jgi:hypothetical protein